MRIAVLGAGNMGTLLAAKLSFNNDVTLFTSNSLQSNIIDVYDKNEKLLFKSQKINISINNFDKLTDNDMIYVTYPSNIWAQKQNEISNYIRSGTYVVFVPAMGGKEYISNVVRNQSKIIGFQRVPYISRIKEKGKSVYMLDKKSSIYISGIEVDNDNIIKIIEKDFGIECYYIENYLNLTLTPSNPILHTSRLYAMFNQTIEYDYVPYFYRDWDIYSSQILFACDDELQQICKSLNNINLSYVKSLKLHYESYNEQQLVDKMKSIESFKQIKAPMLKKGERFYPDYDSRYFTEDFPYGLLIIKGFAVICNVDTPCIDKIIEWEQSMVGKEYLVNGKLAGANLDETGIPQNYGIKTKEDIYKIYCRKLGVKFDASNNVSGRKR